MRSSRRARLRKPWMYGERKNGNGRAALWPRNPSLVKPHWPTRNGGMTMVLKYFRLFGSALIWSALFAVLFAHSAGSQTVRERAEIAAVLAIEKLSVQEGVVSGEIYNPSSHTIRDAQLFIRHTWLWDEEFKPGKDDPGTSIYFTLAKEIPAGGHLPFTYSP